MAKKSTYGIAFQARHSQSYQHGKSLYVSKTEAEKAAKEYEREYKKATGSKPQAGKVKALKTQYTIWLPR